MLISIDHGNLFIKTPHLRFPSGIVRRYVHPPVTNDVLEYNGAIYSLSNNRLSYQYDKTLDERYYLLTLVAIAKELELVHTTRADVDLAVGLPPEHFGRLRAPFAAYFKKSSDPVTFRFAGKTYTVEIRNVMVFPQAFAAAITQQDVIAQYARLVIIDHGGYTFDYVGLRENRLDVDICGSLDSGIISLYNQVREAVNAGYGQQLDDILIQDVLTGKPNILSKDIKRIVQDHARAHVEDNLSKLRELHIDLHTLPVLIIGGGALLLRPYYEQSPQSAKAFFCADTLANAKGFEQLGKAQLQQAGDPGETEKLFRFTMQIPATTPENCKVGDFLESLKNKKARFIVSVVSEYLDAHPELLNHASIVVRTQPSITEAAVLAMIERALAQQPRTSHETVPMDSKEDLAKSMLADIQSLF